MEISFYHIILRITIKTSERLIILKYTIIGNVVQHSINTALNTTKKKIKMNPSDCI